MSTLFHLLTIAASLLLLFVAFEMLRRRKLKERHALWWILAGILTSIVAIFPQVVTFFANLLGVEVASNLVFFTSLLLLSLASLQHSSELTNNEEKLRVLTEEQAMLRQILEELQSKIK